MTDRLPRSNSQSQLPNYGQGQSDNKKDVDKKKDGAPAQSDKNTGQGHSDNNKAAPQMKSKEEKKGREPTESGLNDGRGGYGANFEAILFPGEPGGAKASNTFERMFLGAKPSQVEQKLKNENESSSEDGAAQSESKALKSPRQQQPDNKEKSTNKKVSKISLKNIGNAIASLASDRAEMTISPRKTNRETHRNTQDSTSSTGNTASTAGSTTANTNATTANTAVGNAAIPHTTSVATAPLWQLASPRSERQPHAQPNLAASVKLTETTTTASTSITTTTNTIAVDENTKTKPVVTQQKPKPGGAVPISLLTSEAKKVLEQVQAGKEITGDQLAELLVCVQSRGYTVPLTPELTDVILRNGMVVSVPDSKYPNDPDKEIKINIIELTSTPFMEKYLNTKKMGSLRRKLVSMYKEIYMKLPSNLKNLTAKELRKKDEFTQAMRPLIEPFLKDYIGEELSLSDSRFPEEFKKLLIGIDQRVTYWGEVTKNMPYEKEKINPKLLFEARKSAIAAYVCTRSIIPIWRIAINTDPDFASNKLELFTAYLNTLLTTQIDELYFDVMQQALNQDKAQIELLEAHTRAAKLKAKEKSRKNRIHDVKKENLTKTGGESGVTRGKEKASLRLQKNIEKNNSSRVAVLEQARRREVDALLKGTGVVVFDAQFVHHLKDTVINLERVDYKNFKNNPTGFTLNKLNEFIFDNGPKYDAENILKLKEKLEKLIEQENTRQPEITTANPVISKVTTTVVTTPSTNTTVTQSVEATSSASVPATNSAAMASVPGNDPSTESEKSTGSTSTESSSGDDPSYNSQ